MKAFSTAITLFTFLFTGCSTIYFVKNSSVESILASGAEAHLNRFRIEGYAVSAFEHRVLYSSLKNAQEQKSEKGIWLGGGGLHGSFDPFGRTTKINKVKVEGTILSQKTWMHEEVGGFGHMGVCNAEIVDLIILEEALVSESQ